MASKFDKETLKKHLFWILLGVFVLFWFVGVVIAILPGDDTAEKAYKTSKKGVEDTKKNGVKTAAYQEPWKKHGAKFREHKDKIWAKAWKQQEGMYTWPVSMLKEAARPLYPEDPFVRDGTGKKNVTEDQKIRSTFRTWYHEQFDGLEELVYPAQFSGGFDTVFPEQKWDRESPPTQEEIWLAQEDYWVRRELLFLIRQAMSAVALFQEIPQGKDDKPPEGIAAKRVFRNANWELTLLIETVKDRKNWVISDRSTIKNISVDERTQVLANPRTQRGLPFRFQTDVAYRDIFISGEPLPFGKEAPIFQAGLEKSKRTVAPIDINNPERPFFIEQQLDWEISPVRRVDMIALARHSHRTFVGGLKPNPELKALEPVETPEKTDASGTGSPGGSGSMTPSGGGPPPGGGSAMQMGSPGGAGGPGGTGGPGGAGAATEITTINKIPRDRYLHVTPQCRHLPIVVKLIVDQAHIHDILSSFSNSRLRMQITQVSFHHVRDVTRSTASEVPGTGGSKTPTGPKMPDGPDGPTSPPGIGGSSNPNRGMMMPPMPGSSMTPGGSMAPGGGRVIFGRPTGGGEGGNTRPAGGGGVLGTSKARVIDNARLVELSIYALASIYERFPARPKETTTPTTPVVPGKN